MKIRFLAPAFIIYLTFVSCSDKEKLNNTQTGTSTLEATPSDLFSAVGKGDAHTLEQLLEKKIDLSAKNHEGYTALHLAAMDSDQDLVSLLVGAGADIDSVSKNQTTPLMLAVNEGDSNMVEYLLAQGAQTGLKDDKNRTALILAIDGNHIDTISKLAPYASSELDTALLYASSQGKYQVIDTLTHEGASIYVRHEGGMTPLMLAAQNGHTATVYTLIESGANRYAVNEQGLTAAQVAASADQELIAKFLNEAPADDEFAIIENDDSHGIDWPDTYPTENAYPSTAVSDGADETDKTEAEIPSDTSDSMASTSDDIASITEPLAAVAATTAAATTATTTAVAQAAAPASPAAIVAATPTIVKLPFISGKKVQTASETPAIIAKDLKMLDYKEKPLPIIVEKTTNKNQTKHADIRMLYGEQKTVEVKEGAQIPNTRFKITSIQRKFHESKLSAGRPADISIVEIEDTHTGKRRQMTTSIPASASEPWAVLRSQSSGETYAVRAGQKFTTSSGQPFTITDVRPNQLVIMQDDTGEAMTIPLGR